MTSEHDRWLARARAALAGGVSSHFRMADARVFTRGAGSRLWDADGREYLDFTLSQGPLIHGHSHPYVLERVARALESGQVFSGAHPLEIELAEKLLAILPGAELLRFSTSGSEAVHAALRLARACTGRPNIVKFEGHYHGWLDEVAVSINPPLDQTGPPLPVRSDRHQAVAGPAGTAERPLGGPGHYEPRVPGTAGIAPHAHDAVRVLQWNDLAAVERLLAEQARDIAAIITEPCMCNTGCIEPVAGYLQGLRALCDRHQVILIFDEVITGFRLALGGAAEHYGVTPDLAVYGKAIAAGFPISVLAGRRRIMEKLADGTTIHAGTLNAHVAGVAASLASIELLEREGRAAYAQLYDRGRRLMCGMDNACRAAGLESMVTGPGPVFHLGFRAVSPPANAHGSAPPLANTASTPPLAKGGLGGAEPARLILNYRDAARTYDARLYHRFVEEMAKRGVRLIGRGIWYLSTAHTDTDVDQALATARAAAANIAA